MKNYREEFESIAREAEFLTKKMEEGEDRHNHLISFLPRAAGILREFLAARKKVDTKILEFKIHVGGKSEKTKT